MTDPKPDTTEPTAEERAERSCLAIHSPGADCIGCTDIAEEIRAAVAARDKEILAIMEDKIECYCEGMEEIAENYTCGYCRAVAAIRAEPGGEKG